ncbi:hypothetical protein TRL7639_03223 [Falsiruegeria litorea R37]|uniref:Lipoprotein n=1 Tax=Falsiruegeria litorea R37 TaxID=1200284 RepID=A0A1Y5T965_9RHOB|nr:hypothetical protein TRL7639_03223 [Falsiruegeria litorea R37]
MTPLRALIVGVLGFVLSGCEPPSNMSQEQVNYHKANRASYMFQGR